MSGLEIIGVVASTFQLAEIGIKLSVKLCSFYRQIKDADQSAQRLASDVSLTCSILHELGKTLEHDSQTKLCSQQAFLTAREVLEECEKIFKQIEDAIEKKDPGSGKSKWERGARRLTVVVLGPDLDVLKSHLDRLKSTMLLMLNVIMYAREINRTSDHSSLESQRQLIETLLREKAETEARFERIIKLATARSGGDKEDTLSTSTLLTQPEMWARQQCSGENEVDKYYTLVKSLLDEIDEHQTNLQPDRHSRMRNGVVNVHKAELAMFQQSHGEAVVQAFDSPFFKVYNQDLDSSFTPKKRTKQPPQSSAPSMQHAYGANPSSGRRGYLAYEPRTNGGYNHAPLAPSHESGYGWDSYSDTHRHHRRPRHDLGQSRDNRSSGFHDIFNDRLSAVGPRRITPGVWPSDMSENNNYHRYYPELDLNSDSAQPFSRNLYGNITDESKPSHLAPGTYRPRRREWRSRGRDHDSDGYTDDEDLRKYRHEPEVSPRSRHATETSSAKNRSQPMLENSNSAASQHSSSIDGENGTRNIIKAEAPIAKESDAAPKGILKPPCEKFPEEPTPVREGVAPLKDAHKEGIPPGQRFTKIDRKLVSPEALEAANERYEERLDHVVVRRALSLVEIQAYAAKTQEIRDSQQGEYHREDLPSDKAPADRDEEDDQYEYESMEVDIPALGDNEPGISDFRKETSSSGKEDPRQHVAWETLEDLVLSWTTLSRDMIQL